MRRAPKVLGFVLLAASIGVPAAAQGPGPLADGRWLPFLGCWVEVTAGDGPMTCVVPEGEGVAFLTVSDGEVTTRRLVAAGVERAVEEVGCTGTEVVEFSTDGHRLFTRTTLDCGGTTRRSRGLMAMVDGGQWIDVRALDGQGGSVAWVNRYRTAPESRVEAAGLLRRRPGQEAFGLRAARLAASSTVSVDDLIEAHGRTDTEAVRSWIVEQERPLPLNADALIRLADAGVASDVIDVAVAVSFPERFDVNREVRDDRPGYAYSRFGYGRQRCGAPGIWQPYSWSYCHPFYDRYAPTWYGYGYYGYDAYRPHVVVVRPSTPQSRGRLVKGRGYTHGSSSTAAAPRSSVSPRSSVRSGQGYSSGSSRTSSGSKGKAKPRGSGG